MSFSAGPQAVLCHTIRGVSGRKNLKNENDRFELSYLAVSKNDLKLNCTYLDSMLNELQ